MVLLRRLVGDVLRRHRQRPSRTLRDVSAAARVSLGYLSEIERGRKEASSELLAAICAALDVSLADVLREVSDDLAAIEAVPLSERPLPHTTYELLVRAAHRWPHHAAVSVIPDGDQWDHPAVRTYAELLADVRDFLAHIVETATGKPVAEQSS